MNDDKPQYPKSPVPSVVTKAPVELDFFEALQRTLSGKRITRLAWESNAIFCQMVNDELNIFIREEYHPWTIVPGDITAVDWVVLPELN